MRQFFFPSCYFSKSCFRKNGTLVKLSEPPTILRLSLVAFCSSVYYCHTSVANWCVFAIKILSGSKPDRKAFLWWHFSIILRSSRHDFDFYTSMDCQIDVAMKSFFVALCWDDTGSFSIKPYHVHQVYLENVFHYQKY